MSNPLDNSIDNSIDNDKGNNYTTDLSILDNKCYDNEFKQYDWYDYLSDVDIDMNNIPNNSLVI